MDSAAYPQTRRHPHRMSFPETLTVKEDRRHRKARTDQASVLLKMLTIRTHPRLATLSQFTVIRAFQRSDHEFAPEKAHRSTTTPYCSIPKILTLTDRDTSNEGCEKCVAMAPQKLTSSLAHQAGAHRGTSSQAEHPAWLLLQTLTSTPKRAQTGRISSRNPEEAHPQPAFFPVLAHLMLKTTAQPGPKRPCSTFPYPLTTENQLDRWTFPLRSAVRRRSPRKRSPVVSSSKTAGPEPAHVLSRSGSPRSPNPITETSRSASPSILQSFTLSAGKPCWIRLSRGVNVFNQYQGCLLLLLSTPRPASFPEDKASRRHRAGTALP
ncbi:hypothetical protein SAMN05445871_4393 [Paraburkholderia caballeronis]|uniref:Uncharacterized protein n=1 Tax=Paraburkholderia caballeronis TaxID=416943 RepID=A0A1H7VT92_9BURK|nr:hypothetical protein C7403_12524 [Paraburkholderia caballeronis]PXW93746.1 hypothetical protein C7407_12524 [Paraburkholderia caballeronis]RAJ88986.1 hypothetical protein C7409_12524 [Paraburkholderia caballeronis]SED98137.1 hypothetical protein SAMN05445871_4393 [Paraburkholderia caballeronis]SEM12380.1 hypothetical protein SAMN05192542_12749 [Paraburkholderia caballeronis]